MKSYYLALRPLGDSLISLSLLSRLPARVHDLTVIGTPLVEEVAEATGLARFPIKRALPNVAAFFDLRVRGLRRGVKEILHVRRYLSHALRPDDALLVEQKDWRNLMLVSRTHRTAIEPPRRVSIYADRCLMLERHFNATITLPTANLPSVNCSTILIHPGARQEARALSTKIIGHLFDFAERRGLGIHLIDPSGRHAAWAPRARRYLRIPTLKEAVALLRESDSFIGADSFFLHLAYFYGVPSFAIARTSRFYFAPPGLVEQCASLSLADALQRDKLHSALNRVYR